MCLAVLCGVAGCSDSDDRRIPPVPVRISFVTIGDWQTYGVHGATDFQYFTTEPKQPANFPFTMLTQTGWGGVVLVGDVLGAPRAYDMSCPVEARRDVRIYVDVDKSIARCPKCGSTYAVFELGTALSGEAAQHGWSLQAYNVAIMGGGSEYAVIRN